MLLINIVCDICLPVWPCFLHWPPIASYPDMLQGKIKDLHLTVKVFKILSIWVYPQGLNQGDSPRLKIFDWCLFRREKRHKFFRCQRICLRLPQGQCLSRTALYTSIIVIFLKLKAVLYQKNLHYLSFVHSWSPWHSLAYLLILKPWHLNLHFPLIQETSTWHHSLK